MEEIFTISLETSEVRSKIAAMTKTAEELVVNLVNTCSVRLRGWVREELFAPYPGGTTNTTLSTRSGILKRSISVLQAKLMGDIVRGGIGIGAKYAGVHFGEPGTTPIRPQGHPFLAIPIGAALDSHGVARGSPRDAAIFGKTFIPKYRDGHLWLNKNGNPMIFGNLLATKGKSAGRVKRVRGEGGKLTARGVPLFVLKKEVTIKRRIHPEDLWRFAGPILGNGLKQIKELLESGRSTTG